MNSGIERIKKLSSEITDKPLKKIIEYLLSRKDMNEKYLNEEKNLTQMINFIRDEARKQSTNGMAMIEDDVVYGWAIHYWDEPNENLKIRSTIDNNKKEEAEVSNTQSKKEKQTISNPKKWAAEGQLTLFDL